MHCFREIVPFLWRICLTCCLWHIALNGCHKNCMNRYSSVQTSIWSSRFSLSLRGHWPHSASMSAWICSDGSEA
jgi:hypothetical protein